jgi:hypothetical protein
MGKKSTKIVMILTPGYFGARETNLEFFEFPQSRLVVEDLPLGGVSGKNKTNAYVETLTMARGVPGPAAVWCGYAH